MRPLPTVVRTVALLTVLALALTACKGTRAKNTLNDVSEMIAELENLNASKHAPDKMQDLRVKVDQANSRLANEPGEAFNLAQEAENTANQLLTEVRAAESRDLWNQAEADIQVAETNALNRVDPERYQRILQLRQEATQARTENDYPQVIQLCREISQEVETGISPLRNDAETDLLTAQKKLQDLKSIGGAQYAPEYVIDVQDTINRAITKKEEDRDYVLAANLFRDAQRQAEEGIETVWQAKGKEAIDEIEEIIAEALEEDAREHTPETLEDIYTLLENVISDYDQGLYEKTLKATDDLKPRAIRLRVETKRRAAEARIRQMKNDIDTLVDGGAREYLPGRVEELDTLLASARETDQQDTEEAFDQVKDLYLEFVDEVALIDRQFSALSQDAIRLAQNQLATTKQVYSQVTEIFNESEGAIPPGMKPFEDSKAVRRVQIGEEIASAQRELQEATRRIEDRQYRQAILIAKDQSDVANNLLGELYYTVANNAVIELSNLISRYVRDGAGIYAADELARSVEDLEAVKESINQNEYLKAVEIAGAARANIELMARRISGRAVDDIRAARQALADVSSEKVRRYRAEMLEEVRALIEEAERELQAGRLKLAVETANRATQTANTAQQESNRLSAGDAIQEAVTKLERSQNAGANLYAGREMESARKLFDSAKSLFSGADYEKAEELARSASERADQAFYKKIDEGEAAIADAKAVGGWEYDNSTLSKASADVRNARQALESGQFDLSSELAERAQSRAQSVASATKRHNYTQAVQRIRGNLEEGRQQGINYFQVQDSIGIRQRLAELENEWTLDRYDYVMSELMKLEGRLRQTLQSTGEVVTVVAEQQEERLNGLVGEGAADYAADLIQRAQDNLKYALIDYRKGQYKSAHSALDQAITDINEIQRRHDQEAYVDEVQDVLQGYSEAQHQFRNVLSLDPAELKALASGRNMRGNTVAIAGQATPGDFREDVERLYSTVLRITPPEGLEKIHESLIQAFNEGRIAAIHFERLIILNEASSEEVDRLINTAYSKINSSNKMIGELQRKFFADEVRMRLVSAEAISGVPAR